MGGLTESWPVHDQVGMDLAKHASDRASKVMIQTLELCDTHAQASMVAFHVLGVIAAQACGVITKHLEIEISDLGSAELLELMADLMKEVESGRAALESSDEQ